ncbi:MAG TPA: hypothetical protein VIY47_07575 [Ignavibacteriaceae bacterium]
MAYTTQELANTFKMSKRTLERRLKNLRENKKFTKESQGNLYNEFEAIEIARLLGYNFPTENKTRQVQPGFIVNFTSQPNNPK